MSIDVSVVMSVFNGEPYLDEAIKSILNQTYTNFEFIIVDDGSTDKSKDIIKSYSDPRIILIEQTNAGIAIALNNGIRISKGKYIARMDMDDIALPQRLELQVKFLNNHTDYVLVGTNAIIIDKFGDYVYNSNLPFDWEVIKTKFPDTSFYHSSVMFHSNVFFKVGGYFEEISRYNCFEDTILWNRMQVHGNMANLQEPLIKYRLVPNASTTKSGKHEKEIQLILKDIINSNQLDSKNRDKLNIIKEKIDKKEKERLYNIHLAKKFLFNNYQPKKARYNLRLAIKQNVKITYPYFLLLLSLLPYSFIRIIYKFKNQ